MTYDVIKIFYLKHTALEYNYNVFDVLSNKFMKN